MKRLNTFVALLVSTLIAAQSFAESRTSLLFGTQLGYLGLTTRRANEVNKSGIEGSARLLISHTTQNFAFDLGAGYAYSHLTGDTIVGVQTVSTDTRSFLADFSPRYLVTERWQVGPVVQFFSGGDVSYDEDGGYNESSSLWRAGVRANYEWNKTWLYRIGAQVITDLNISNRNVLGILIDFQIGLTPIRAPDAESAPVPAASTKIEAPQFAEMRDRAIRLYLGEALLSFPKNSTKLNQKAKEALGRLAPVLARTQTSWSKLRIEGHTDPRNKNNQNQMLSEKRAQSVAQELIRQGVPEAKVQAVGLASTVPIDPSPNEEAYLLNRRVEIWLEDVSPNEIKEVWSELKQVQ